MIRKIKLVFSLVIFIFILYYGFKFHNYESDTNFQSTFNLDTIPVITPGKDSLILNKPVGKSFKNSMKDTGFNGPN